MIPRVSVAMCTYNGAQFLQQQLESIAVQTLRPHELVICDDHSSDSSVEMVSDFARRAPFPVRVYENESNLGVSKNFEKVLGLCEAEIIALADQDDVWMPHKLVTLSVALQRNPSAGYVFSDAEIIDETGALVRPSLWSSLGINRAIGNEFADTRQVTTMLRRAVATGATMAFRATLKEIVLPTSPHLLHDYWISLIASSLHFYGVAVPEPLIRYRRHQRQQIGPGGRTIFQKVRWARGITSAYYDNTRCGFEDVRERLFEAVAAGHVCNESDLGALEGKIKHASRRAIMHSTRGSAKLVTLFSEVLSGRYETFSNSWRSVVEDLCF